MSANTAIRYCVETVDTGFYLVSASPDAARFTDDFAEATKYHTFTEADKALRIAAPLEKEGLRLVRLAEPEDDDREPTQ